MSTVAGDRAKSTTQFTRVIPSGVVGDVINICSEADILQYISKEADKMLLQIEKDDIEEVIFTDDFSLHCGRVLLLTGINVGLKLSKDPEGGRAALKMLKNQDAHPIPLLQGVRKALKLDQIIVDGEDVQSAGLKLLACVSSQGGAGIVCAY